MVEENDISRGRAKEKLKEPSKKEKLQNQVQFTISNTHKEENLLFLFFTKKAEKTFLR